ncbi:hypothetical protein CCACVL1_27039 [Corchorus capsularis]|uniref:Uncharacterized protein n=1 Tax=Corchorus capsularis TaxID=210143 RepID=A0A1R3GCJ8_COCAP|nr:hypothetical protein CCACVL1_27039 [Corchorus capsularis]
MARHPCSLSDSETDTTTPPQLQSSALLPLDVAAPADAH